MTDKLTLNTLADHAKTVAIPSYSRDSLSAGIVHIGVGNFHRAHQAIYLDRLFNLGLDHDWALIGAGIMPGDKQIREDLASQDWLTTVVELDPSGLNARICGSMIDFCEINPAILIDRLSQPEIRIVSLTVTEGGYFIDAKTGGVDISHPDIRADIANPRSPQTVFGIIIAALVNRRAAGITPFTIMSCDNIPENGKVTRATVSAIAARISSELADWISEEVAFPNSMVDCITPATSDTERSMTYDTFGIEDKRPVVCEPFRQWVLEDNFPSGRPALERVGVEFVDNVAPYELMKLRILNGGHATIAYPAALMGIEFAAAAMAEPLIAAYLDKLIGEEVIPTLSPIKGVDFHEYFAKVRTRFANSRIGDTIPRLCLDGSNRQPKFILPVVNERLADNQSINGLALEVALWCRYCAGTNDNGEPIEIADKNASRLNYHALKAKTEPAIFLSMHDIFGDLENHDKFASTFATALKALWKTGSAVTLKNYISGELFDDHMLR